MMDMITKVEEILKGPLQATVNDIYYELRDAGQLDTGVIAIAVYADRTTVGLVRDVEHFTKHLPRTVVEQLSVPPTLPRMVRLVAFEARPPATRNALVTHYAPLDQVDVGTSELS